MSRKFPIVNVRSVEINFNKLSKEIYEYTMLNGEEPYLFMHINTFQAILAELQSALKTFFDPVYAVKAFEGSDVKALYEGCKVFINNGLEFGIVEIR